MKYIKTEGKHKVTNTTQGTKILNYFVSPFLDKAYVTLNITPVVGTTPVTAGDDRWQTSPQYLEWTTRQEVHQVNINLLINLKRMQEHFFIIRLQDLNPDNGFIIIDYLCAAYRTCHAFGWQKC